jgi:hypothetical protein
MTKNAGIVLLLLLLPNVHAHAKPPRPAPPAPAATTAPRPWAEGVNEEQQTEAFRIFKEGNALFAESQHAAALAKYREALKVWDHPAIRYNAAVALMNLDQPLVAFQNLELALKYGDAPLGAETYKQAMLYKKLLAGQLAELEVACDEAGAEVLLDGEVLFTAPGRQERRLMPGSHQLVARKNGYFVETRALQLPSGKRTQETVKLQLLSAVPMRAVRRWTAWKPWAVFAAGLVVAAVGVPLILDAKSKFDTFDSEIARLCPSGCQPGMLPTTVVEAQDSGHAENAAAIGMFAAGGAVAAVGIVLLILNQPRLERDLRAMPVTLAPVVGPGTGGLQASIRY